MHKLQVALLTALCALALTSRAQEDTNILKTKIGLFEAQTGTVIIKGFDPVGSMSVGGNVISVSCKASSEAATSRLVYGLAIGIAGSDQPRDRTFVDYDEIDSMLDGINYLNKITYNVTPLTGFEAAYTTRTGLRVVAYSARRQGTTQTFLQYCDRPRIPLSSDQMTQFYNLIAQAKKNLDSIRTTK